MIPELVLAAVLATASTSGPATPASVSLQERSTGGFESGTMEIGALGGWAFGTVFDPQRTETSFAEALVRWAIHFPRIGGGWRRGQFSLVAEGVPLFTIEQEPRATGGGVNLLIRYTIAGQRWRPSILAGAGILFTNEDVPPGETDLNFTPQGGIALQYLLRPRLAIGGEYRFHHLSNNGQTESNPGINSQLLLFGVSWYR